MRRLSFLLCVLAAAGCGGVNPGTNPDPVEVSGRVTMKAQPVTGVVLNLQPTSGGSQATLPLNNGGFKGHVVPGRYTYFISEGKSAAAFQAIPEKYKLGAMDRQVDVSAGTTLTLALD